MTSTPSADAAPATTPLRAGGAPSLPEILERAARIEPLTTFPPIDELVAGFDALANGSDGRLVKRRIGTSRLGEPIHEYVVGSGSRHALIVGGVHPNEPIGFHTARVLAEHILAEPDFFDRFDATWHIIPSIDPDGARLNEGWFANPGDRSHYARNFYRPAPQEQVEWSFPLSYKDAYFDRPMPETQALMQLMVETHPALLVGLHNAELGGVYYYVSRELSGGVDALHAIPAALDLPLDAGEPESADLTALAQAVYLSPLATDHYDYLEALGVDPTREVGGAGSADYAAQFGTLVLIAELPYWSHPDALDTRPSDLSYDEVLRRKADGLRETGRILNAALTRAEPHLTIESPFLRASRAFVPMMSAAGDAEAARAELPESHRAATIAEAFTNADLVRCFRLRFGGMLVRALEGEVAAGIAPVPVRRAAAELRTAYDEWIAESDDVTGLEVLPVEKLVGVQYASTLVMAALLAGDDS
ncbi:zinc carboxypeptidase [Labedella gwakjiensis]|uniref:Peptidase M14 n=1 Tax=Labedella gwakjiensis TaxID=390269 RepID=A0A2P8GZA7_9MICO|nr:M14 family zinc carboxypeptidase [Labedella gwakjiensis]PSL39290.1 zinc carboxypeptidase [Labedella gwakjiensis]RUQ86287.1 peptidase M14 [Labedella gwakjiensis]